LAVSGARYFSQKRADGRQQEGVDFFLLVANVPIPRIAVENPVGIMSNRYRKPDQIIQPWQFGHPESKATCLWLKNLPKLVPTKALEPEWITRADGKRYNPAHNSRAVARARWQNQTSSGQNKLTLSTDRWKLRSITYKGIAEAMADQWGGAR